MTLKQSPFANNTFTLLAAISSSSLNYGRKFLSFRAPFPQNSFHQNHDKPYINWNHKAKSCLQILFMTVRRGLYAKLFTFTREKEFIRKSIEEVELQRILFLTGSSISLSSSKRNKKSLCFTKHLYPIFWVLFFTTHMSSVSSISHK